MMETKLKIELEKELSKREPKVYGKFTLGDGVKVKYCTN
jgi:hypothetical protein